MRQNQTPHTGDIKIFAVKEKNIDRGKMWTETHKKKDGCYVTEVAREIGVSILSIHGYSSRPKK
ncbi:hypothetical protein RDI58_022057 [Solanum bulbocastanum]|uniref:Uncharacterized protein n=1 Tax=Solanum bulbocastanum TaxID=147425 RepID=A0AAN8T8N9_SOLBU